MDATTNLNPFVAFVQFFHRVVQAYEPVEARPRTEPVSLPPLPAELPPPPPRPEEGVGAGIDLFV
ncbi:hypothetical protein HS125_09595 [bacterium]|nr:hypothetical protein [bacterium]